MNVEPHEITLLGGDLAGVQQEDGSMHLATVTPAKNAAVIEVLRADVSSMDGRSQWVWVRLADGTLILGVFPQGDTYINVVEAEEV